MAVDTAAADRSAAVADNRPAAVADVVVLVAVVDLAAPGNSL